jgi:hypothetical protein
MQLRMQLFWLSFVTAIPVSRCDQSVFPHHTLASIQANSQQRSCWIELVCSAALLAKVDLAAAAPGAAAKNL